LAFTNDAVGNDASVITSDALVLVFSFDFAIVRGAAICAGSCAAAGVSGMEVSIPSFFNRSSSLDRGGGMIVVGTDAGIATFKDGFAAELPVNVDNCDKGRREFTLRSDWLAVRCFSIIFVDEDGDSGIDAFSIPDPGWDPWEPTSRLDRCRGDRLRADPVDGEPDGLCTSTGSTDPTPGNTGALDCSCWDTGRRCTICVSKSMDCDPIGATAWVMPDDCVPALMFSHEDD